MTTTYNNGLISIPQDTLFYRYARLALEGKLWFYDDHQQVLGQRAVEQRRGPGLAGARPVEAVDAGAERPRAGSDLSHG